VDEEDVVEPAEQYELYLWIASGGKPDWRYTEERWFVERPDREIVGILLEEAKQTYASLFPGSDPQEVSVMIKRLRPADNHRLDFKPLVE